jgi:hypothetical protein
VKKGMKLDFKSIEVVEESLKILQQQQGKVGRIFFLENARTQVQAKVVHGKSGLTFERLTLGSNPSSYILLKSYLRIHSIN